ncbi:MAG: 3,4-dihydroxy 2-butanone 4-phosphate synthase/GTP cyclohydrolase II [Myxococcota bacterium]|jgi:3,4-dihydroxy 2-butanone 4-phosphate synthase/GTP cyclohydrolase II
MIEDTAPASASTNPVASAIETFRRGGMVLISDSNRPERGGIVATSAERTSDDVVNFLATYACGLVSVALPPSQLERLGLVPSAREPGLDRERFTASIEARDGVTTGISAADRARTIQIAVAHTSRPEDIVSPGHIFPVAADPGGVVIHPGWAEAGIDLARLAGVQAAATYCQVLDLEGELASPAVLAEFAACHGLVHISLDDIVDHRMATESFVTQRHQTLLPTAHGEFVVRAFENTLNGRQHLALSLGSIRTSEPILVRLHSECLTGDVFGSRRCDCGLQLEEALRRIRAEGRGVVLYMRQEGRGIGLANKLRAYSLQDVGRDTVEANVELGLPIDQRDYSVAAQMLLALGVHRVRLMTNNPRKVAGITRGGVIVTARENIEITPGTDNAGYLKTKKDKLGHMLEQV